MGAALCKWKGDHGDMDALARETLTIDSEEENLYLNASRNGAMRQRSETHDRSAAQHDILAIHEALAFQVYLLKESDEEFCPVAASQQHPAGHVQISDDSNNASSPQPAVLSSNTSPAATKEAKLLKIAELEADQRKRREHELMTVDAGCWESMAEQGQFQKAEDLLSAAAVLEEKRHGETERYAMLMHSLGALYDFRSNVDVTGQQQHLSFESARLAERAVHALRVLTSALESYPDRSSERLRLMDYLAKSLLMRGKSLCNTALEGDCKHISAEDAFDDAEKDAAEAAKIREDLKHPQLAEGVMAIGYVHYCRACRVLNSKDAESVVGRIAFMEDSYSKALDQYKQSLNLYLDTVGPEHTDSIRMRCNIALVYNVMSRVPCEARLQYLVEAETHYEQVLKIQQKVFGKRHQRTQRIELDLKDTRRRKAELEASEDEYVKNQIHYFDGQGSTEAWERERKAKADALMVEFLNQRRKELSSVAAGTRTKKHA